FRSKLLVPDEPEEQPYIGKYLASQKAPVVFIKKSKNSLFLLSITIQLQVYSYLIKSCLSQKVFICSVKNEYSINLQDTSSEKLLKQKNFLSKGLM
ncbi:MAG: hypothetical protein RMI30_05920, partial [Thermodesulfovibrio sp.]|nr:hypothetical protein [Thermodesulfovibrio sp.]